MEQQQQLVKAALLAWEANIKRATNLFNGYTEEQLFTEIAPGKNRPVYLLGHMVAVHDRLLPLLGLGERLYPQLDDAFINNPDKAVAELPAVEELRAYWANVNQKLNERFQELTPAEWLQKHTQVSDEEVAKEPHRNRFSVLLSRTNHLASHLGQLAYVKK